MNFVSRGRRGWLGFLAAAAAFSSAAGARADDDAIGVASVVRNNVSGVLPSGAVKIDTGASVVRNEVVITAEDSSTKLVFTDSTNLAIGPSSTVRLSNFVSAGPSTYGKAAIDVVGARLGKAGGSVIQQALIAVYHSLRAVPGQIAGILLVVIGAWMWADLGLGRAFGRLTRAREKARPEPQPGEPVRWSGKG